MTVFLGSDYRGVFDPISLGLHAPSYLDDMRWEDEISTQDWGTFVHELTHYFQFLGTNFGIGYINGLVARTQVLGVILRRIVEKKDEWSIPVSYSGIDLRDYCSSKKELELFSSYMMVWRYYQEDIFGWSFPIYSYRPILSSKNPFHHLRTSFLYIEEDSDTAFPVTGEYVLEGQASTNEINFLSHRSPSERIYNNIMKRNYNALNGVNHAKYNGLNLILAKVGLGYLRELIYFIVLNQPFDNIIDNLGEYRLVRLFKKIVHNAYKINRQVVLEKINEEEILFAIDIICKIMDFENPFERLSKTLKELARNDKSFGFVSSRSWISQRLIEWQIENKFEAIFWPLGPQVIIESVPIFNLYFKNTIPEIDRHGLLCLMVSKGGDLDKKLSLGNDKKIITDKMISEWLANAITEYSSQSLEIYLINGLFENTKTRCPLFVWSKPTICNSCEACSGFFPKIKHDKNCIVIRHCNELFIDKLVTNEEV